MKKKLIIILTLSAILLSSCTRSTGTGMVIGSQFGGMLGSVFGDAAGGHSGRLIGAMMGMTAGAVIGEKIETSNIEKREREIRNYKKRVIKRTSMPSERGIYMPSEHNSGYDEVQESRDEEVDDRIEMFDTPENTNHSETSLPINTGENNANWEVLKTQNATQYGIEIKRFEFTGSQFNNTLLRNETATIVVELYNSQNTTLYNVEPIVQEITKNKGILLSSNVNINKIEPYKTIRYTLTVVGTRSLKNGSAIFALKVKQDGRILSQDKIIEIETRKK